MAVCDLAPENPMREPAAALPAAEGLPIGTAAPAGFSGASSSGSKRVLLVEGDGSFNEIIEQLKAGSAYEVTAVNTGADALNEVLNADFAIILCDMDLPALRGNTFYRVLERMRPDLCEMFIFMTGQQAEGATSDFIRSVNGRLLLKPFHLNDLLDCVGAVETSRRSASRPASPLLNHSEAAVTKPASRPPTRATPSPLPAAVTSVSGDRVATSAQDSPAHPVEGAMDPAVQCENPRWSSGTLLRVGAVAVVVLIALGWYAYLRSEVATLSAECLAEEQQWMITSAELQEAEEQRRRMGGRVKRAERLAWERNVRGWAQALRSVATAVGANVQLQDVSARGEPDAPGVCKLRVSGVSTGRKPIETADRFLTALDAELKQVFAKEGATTRFESLEDSPPSNSVSSDERERHAFFTITATVGSKAPAGLVATGKK